MLSCARVFERHSGDPDKPRILGAFNEQTPDWLSYFMFTYFTDRDGKYQLASLAESSFDPLARTCMFMLTEEAHHMFVGETGIRRTVQRTCEAMNELGTDDPERVRASGLVDLYTIQRFINRHFSVSVDLFGRELSTNAANYFTSGLKGRFHETRIDDDHELTNSTRPVHTLEDGRIVIRDQPALIAINEHLRDDYIKDCQRGIDRWNKVIQDQGIDFELRLPHRGFSRQIGMFADVRISPKGEVLTEREWADAMDDWLPTDDDHAFVASLMKRVVEPGKMASWIAPPLRGINGKPIEFEYVKF